MLVLSRKKNEAIRIGDDITIVITDIGKNKVGIAIDAPKSLKILREELLPLTKVQTCQQ
jgi:carbon storage regulator